MQDLQGGKLWSSWFGGDSWSMREYTQDFFILMMIFFSFIIAIYVLLVLPSYPLRVPQSLTKTVTLKSKELIIDGYISSQVIPSYKNMYPANVVVLVEVINKLNPLNVGSLELSFSSDTFPTKTQKILDTNFDDRFPDPKTKYSYYVTSFPLINKQNDVLKINKTTNTVQGSYSIEVTGALDQTNFDGEIKITTNYNFYKVH